MLLIIQSKRTPVVFRAIMLEHRTIQQQAFELMLTCIQTWAKLPEHGYDLRNEYTVQKSREIMVLFPGGPRVPLI